MKQGMIRKQMSYSFPSQLFCGTVPVHWIPVNIICTSANKQCQWYYNVWLLTQIQLKFKDKYCCAIITISRFARSLLWYVSKQVSKQTISIALYNAQLISKALRYDPCVARDHTVLPATHTRTIPAFTPQPQGITALRTVPTCTAWWTEAHRCEKHAQSFYAACPAETRTHDLLITSPILYRQRHDATDKSTFNSQEFSSTDNLLPTVRS